MYLLGEIWCLGEVRNKVCGITI